MELFKDTHIVELELLSNATTIDSALHYIRNNQQEQRREQHLEPEETPKIAAGTTTTNQVF